MKKNKILALALTTILTMGSTIPAFAATKLSSQDGNFNKAFSYGKGKYIYT